MVNVLSIMVDDPKLIRILAIFFEKAMEKLLFFLSYTQQETDWCLLAVRPIHCAGKI